MLINFSLFSGIRGRSNIQTYNFPSLLTSDAHVAVVDCQTCKQEKLYFRSQCLTFASNLEQRNSPSNVQQILPQKSILYFWLFISGKFRQYTATFLTLTLSGSNHPLCSGFIGSTQSMWLETSYSALLGKQVSSQILLLCIFYHQSFQKQALVVVSLLLAFIHSLLVLFLPYSFDVSFKTVTRVQALRRT